MLGWFNSRNPKSQRQPARRQPPRGQLESLERRDLMTVTFHGGALMPHVEVQAVYYGRDWSTNTTYKNQAISNEGFLKNVVNSSYMDMLTNAGYNVGRGTFDSGRILLKDVNKSYYLTDSQIRTDLQSLVSNGSLKAPDANRLFIVYVEPGVAIKNDHSSNSTSQKDFLGYHGAYAGRDASGRSADMHYAVIAYPGGYNPTASSQGFKTNFDQLTAVASHELAEAVTDPNVNYKKLGWYDDQKGEIGDIVNGQEVVLNGYVVQKEADKSGRAMSPAGSSAYRSLSSSSLLVGMNLQTVEDGSAHVVGLLERSTEPNHGSGPKSTTVSTLHVETQLGVSSAQPGSNALPQQLLADAFFCRLGKSDLRHDLD